MTCYLPSQRIKNAPPMSIISNAILLIPTVVATAPVGFIVGGMGVGVGGIGVAVGDTPALAAHISECVPTSPACPQELTAATSHLYVLPCVTAKEILVVPEGTCWL